MARNLMVALGIVLGLAAGRLQPVAAQQTSGGTFGSRNLGGGVSASAGSRNQGLTQTGQISSDAAIQRGTGGFVGADAGDSSAIRSLSGAGGGGGGNTGRGGANPFGASGFGGGGFGGQQGAGRNTQGTQGRGQNSDPRLNLRIPMRLGFTPSVSVASQARAHLATWLTRIPQLNVGRDTIAVQMEGRTAVLRGVVANDHQRELAARLALFEPGVSDVRNELTVQATRAEPETLPLPLP